MEGRSTVGSPVNPCYNFLLLHYSHQLLLFLFFLADGRDRFEIAHKQFQIAFKDLITVEDRGGAKG